MLFEVTHLVNGFINQEALEAKWKGNILNLDWENKRNLLVCETEKLRNRPKNHVTIYLSFYICLLD